MKCTASTVIFALDVFAAMMHLLHLLFVCCCACLQSVGFALAGSGGKFFCVLMRSYSAPVGIISASFCQWHAVHTHGFNQNTVTQHSRLKYLREYACCVGVLKLRVCA